MNPKFGESSPASSTDASLGSSRTPPIQSATPPWTLANKLFVILLVSLGGLLPLGAVLWAKHREGQITHVEDLGLARDVQWLGASDGHWLLRTPAGGWLTLDGSHRGWAMEPDARLLRKTSTGGRRWVCDATLVHCIPTADEKQTLAGGGKP